jgi:ammonia channel protein AmtB
LFQDSLPSSRLRHQIVTPAIISGAMVERISFRAWIVFVFLWTTIVYDPLGKRIIIARAHHALVLLAHA